jgi:hypothetical protein
VGFSALYLNSPLVISSANLINDSMNFDEMVQNAESMEWTGRTGKRVPDQEFIEKQTRKSTLHWIHQFQTVVVTACCYSISSTHCLEQKVSSPRFCA